MEEVVLLRNGATYSVHQFAEHERSTCVRQRNDQQGRDANGTQPILMMQIASEAWKWLGKPSSRL